MEQKRSNYQEKAHETLDEILRGIELLEEEAKGLSRNFSDSVEQSIRQLRAECEGLKLKLGELAGTSGEAWEELRGGFEQAGASLRNALARARDKYREK